MGDTVGAAVAGAVLQDLIAALVEHVIVRQAVLQGQDSEPQRPPWCVGE